MEVIHNQVGRGTAVDRKYPANQFDMVKKNMIYKAFYLPCSDRRISETWTVRVAQGKKITKGRAFSILLEFWWKFPRCFNHKPGALLGFVFDWSRDQADLAP